MSKLAGARKYLKSNSRKIHVERSKTTAKVYKCDEEGKLCFSRYMFLWPKRSEVRSNIMPCKSKKPKPPKK